MTVEIEVARGILLFIVGLMLVAICYGIYSLTKMVSNDLKSGMPIWCKAICVLLYLICVGILGFLGLKLLLLFLALIFG